MIDISSQLSILLDALIWSFVLMGIFWAANHTWVEGEKIKGLVLYPINVQIKSFSLYLDSLNIAGFVWNLAVLTAGVWLPLWGLCNAIAESNPDYLYFGFWLLSLLMFNKSFADTFVFVLGCNRCMPTFWIALPGLIFHTSEVFYFGNPAYLANFGRVLVVTCVVSALNTLIGLAYNKLMK